MPAVGLVAAAVGPASNLADLLWGLSQGEQLRPNTADLLLPETDGALALTAGPAPPAVTPAAGVG